MRGWQLTFYTQQGRSHGTRSIAEWLVAEAKALGISGATMSTAQGGYGRDGGCIGPTFSSCPSSRWK